MSKFQIDAVAIVVSGMAGTIVEMLGLSFVLSLLVTIVVMCCVLYFLGKQLQSPWVPLPPLRRKHRRYVGWFE